MSPAPRFRSLLALVVCAFAASPAMADGYDHEGRDPANSIHAGAGSIEFLTFGGGVNGIYGTWLASNRVAIRAGTSFYFRDESGDTPPGVIARTETNRTHDITVVAGIQDYVDASGPVTIFIGFAPYYHHQRFLDAETRYQIASGSVYADSSRFEGRAWAVGGEASAGFQWFFRRKLSVLGRVAGNLEFGRERDSEYYRSTVNGTVDYLDDRKMNSKVVSASTSSAALGLAVHF